MAQPAIAAAPLLALIATGLLAGLAVGGLAAKGGRRRWLPTRASSLAACGAAALSASVLADSAIEHYRGSFKKAPMAIAPPVAAMTLAAAVATALSTRFGAAKRMLFGSAVATGLLGNAFHVRNILRRPGRLSFNNLFYRAPFGAPAALALAGAAGLGAVAAQSPIHEPRTLEALRRERTGRVLGALTGVGLLGLGAEVGLLHFRGAFHNRLMFAPVVALPLTAASVLAATQTRSPRLQPTLPQQRRWHGAHAALQTTAALGLIGSGLHAYGVSRSMGGFGNWTQNLFAGPPLAAPPSLAGIALIGFAALELCCPAHQRAGHD